jgi:hypothetical protein
MSDEAEERDDLRADLSAAIGSVESTPEPTPAVDAEPEKAVPAEPKSKPEAKTPAEGRDEKGRFAGVAKDVDKAVAAKPVIAKAPDAVPPPEPAPVVTAPTVKAPQSWRPAIREQWAKLPSEVQQEVARVEREATQRIGRAAEAEKTAQQLREVIGPYEGMIRAEGGDTFRAINSLMQTAMALRTAPPAHKAQLVAQLVKGYGVDVSMLDQCLAGQAPQGGQQQYADPRQVVREELQQLMAQSQRQRQESELATARQEAETFSADHEFFEDLREEMADMVELAARRRVALSLEDAYARACKLHPEISQVMQQREAAKSAANATASTQRSKAAASSIRSQPTAGVAEPAKSGSLRDDLDAAIASLTG